MLAKVIAGLLLTVSQETNTITHEVLEKVNNDAQLASRLSMTLWRDSLDTFDEEREDFFVLHTLNNFAVDFRQH